jgi:hypothetical protein
MGACADMGKMWHSRLCNVTDANHAVVKMTAEVLVTSKQLGSIDVITGSKATFLSALVRG